MMGQPRPDPPARGIDNLLPPVVESPDKWHFPYFDDAMGSIIEGEMESAVAMLMGRRLYEEWSSYWPGQGPDVPFSEFMNTIPK